MIKTLAAAAIADAWVGSPRLIAASMRQESEREKRIDMIRARLESTLVALTYENFTAVQCDAGEAAELAKGVP